MATWYGVFALCALHVTADVMQSPATNIDGFPERVDVVACIGETLNLTCPEHWVATAEVYYGASPQADADTCRHLPGDCLSRPLTLLPDINRCNWKQSACLLPVRSRPFSGSCGRPQYAVAKGFACVSESSLHDICEGDIKDDLQGHIKSPQFPNSFDGYLRCEMAIRLREMGQLTVRVISADLPPITGEQCAEDYIELETPDGATRICGAVNITRPVTWSYESVGGAIVTLRFISRKAPPLDYAGFALQYQQTDWEPPSTERTSRGTTIRPPTTGSVGGATSNTPTWHAMVFGLIVTVAWRPLGGT